MVRRAKANKNKNKRPSGRLTVVDDAKVISSGNEEDSPTNRKTDGAKVIWKGNSAKKRLDAVARYRREKELPSSSRPQNTRMEQQERESSTGSSSPDEGLELFQNRNNDSSDDDDEDIPQPAPAKKRPAASPAKKRPAASPAKKRRAASPAKKRPAASPAKKRPAASPRVSKAQASVSQPPRKRARKSLAVKVPSRQELHVPKGGNAALAEIRYYQRQTGLCIPRAAFQRVVRETTDLLTGISDLRYQSDALTVIQEAAEQYLTGLIEDANLLALHARRITVQVKDMVLTRRIRKDNVLYGLDNRA